MPTHLLPLLKAKFFIRRTYHQLSSHRADTVGWGVYLDHGSLCFDRGCTHRWRHVAACVASRNQLEEGLILPRNLDRLSNTFDISKYQRILGAFQMGKICPHDESTQHLEDNLCDQLVLNPHFRKVGRYPYYFQWIICTVMKHALNFRKTGRAISPQSCLLENNVNGVPWASQTMPPNVFRCYVAKWSATLKFLWYHIFFCRLRRNNWVVGIISSSAVYLMKDGSRNQDKNTAISCLYKRI